MSFSIYPIGDSAVIIELGTVISESDNRKVIAMQCWLKENQPPGIKEITLAYSSLSVCYDLIAIRKLTARGESAFGYISRLLEQSYHQCIITTGNERVIKMPVCYHPSLGLDLDYLATQQSLTINEVVRLHLSRLYRVYMIGFLPGFPYMGEVDEKIAIERKSVPRPLVPKGSIGIAGRQTGIYPLHSPGGWQIIGRTPFKLFDRNGGEVVSVNAGDYVQFSEISLEEFHQLNN